MSLKYTKLEHFKKELNFKIFQKMKQTILFCLLAFLVLSVSSENSFISKNVSRKNLGFDQCKVCIDFATQALDQLLNTILNIGVVGECSTLCSYVEKQSGSQVLEVVCNVLCDLVGVDEFVKIIDQADLDPIYYCELLKTCAIKDDGDATITSFTVAPISGSQGTKFNAVLNYVSMNGTGTGELEIAIKTVDGIDLGNSFLIESLAPGKYEEKISIKTDPDPDCDPTQEECELWLPGLYFVEIGNYF